MVVDTEAYPNRVPGLEGIHRETHEVKESAGREMVPITEESLFKVGARVSCHHPCHLKCPCLSLQPLGRGRG